MLEAYGVGGTTNDVDHGDRVEERRASEDVPSLREMNSTSLCDVDVLRLQVNLEQLLDVFSSLVALLGLLYNP